MASPDATNARYASGHTPAKEFVDAWLFSSEPFAFALYEDNYSKFRRELATTVDVHPADICLVGSARLGFSLNPEKLLSKFSSGSDLDVVIVSSSIFDLAWTDLLARSNSAELADVDEKQKLKKTRENFFEGYLRPDRLPLASHLAKAWFPKLAGPYRSLTAQRHETTAWLFKSWWHAEHFYVANVERVQPAIRKLLDAEGRRT